MDMATHEADEPANILKRPNAPLLDAVLGHRFPVLADGFVRVIDYLGNDESIVQAARVSYGAGTKRVQEDRALIRYLFRNSHTTPFEMCELKLHVRVPMDCWRQWVRHRTASINEYSTRYSVAIDSMQATSPADWRLQATDNRQGSAGRLSADLGTTLTDAEAELHSHARRVYLNRLEAGVAREQARKDLPLSTYTEAYWKIDLHNLLHFLTLRLDPHAQDEIRRYAELIATEILPLWCPQACEAFRDFRLGAINLSAFEALVVSLIASGDTDNATAQLAGKGLLPKAGTPMFRSSERDELERKLGLLNLAAPWRTLPRPVDR